MLTSCAPVPLDGPIPESYSRDAREHLHGTAEIPHPDPLPFVLVDITAEGVRLLENEEASNYFRGAFTDRREAADIRIGLGDTIRVTIFEAGSGGLFVPTGGTLSGGNFVSIPDQEVDRTGSITVPYAAENNDGGVIKVHKLRPIEVQAEIERRLADRAIEPQVIVTIVNRTSNLYSVLGDVNDPGRYNVTQGGIRVLDAIGAAGGPRGAPYNTLVTLQRSGNSATARLSTLLEEPENNIFVQPNDIISLEKEERYINVFGALNTSSRIAFDEETLSVADVIAESGGLDDARSDPSSVLIYRNESRETLKRMGANLEDFPLTGDIPTVYRVDLKRPSGFFLAQKMPLRNRDMMYVSNHPLTNLSKVLSILRDILLIRLIDQ